ncbi:hypothetical protein D3C72_1770710 [compost metagenome]
MQQDFVVGGRGPGQTAGQAVFFRAHGAGAAGGVEDVVLGPVIGTTPDLGPQLAAEDGTGEIELALRPVAAVAAFLGDIVGGD